MRRVAALALLLALTAGCGSVSDREEEPGLNLRAVPASDRPLRESDLDDAVRILENRLERAHIDATLTRREDWRVAVELDDDRTADVDRAVELATSRGVLEFYDLEARLVRPSIDDQGWPVPTDSLYELLVGRQQTASEDRIEAWYLFDPERDVAGGPSPAKELLLPGGELLGGWRILGTPPGTVVLECGVGEVVCPGVGVERPGRDSYYLVEHAPALHGGDLELAGTRQDFDIATGEPIVTMRFTPGGAESFGEITKRLADRGRGLYDRAGASGDAAASFQHFAVVLDREIKSWPSIDFEQYPDGVAGDLGVQISGLGDPQEAKDLALVLQTGALPVRFQVVSRTAGG